ncbi:MAG: cell division protein FtsA [Methylacidiphilales bacterium]|nr:cell division protein FtsA [Candidatus Methylacidiphilales bacterium]
MVKKYERYIGVIDLGSYNLKCLIAKENDDTMLDIVGYSNTRSMGIEKGVIVDYVSAGIATRTALREAENMSGRSIDHLIIGLQGSHISTMLSNGSIKITNEIVSHNDIQSIMQSTLSYFNAHERVVLHNVPERFVLDNQEQYATKTPFGLTGKRMDVSTLIVSTSAQVYQTFSRCLNSIGAKNYSICALPITSALAIMNSDDKDLGVCVLDIGASITTVSLYSQGTLRHLSTVEYAGKSVTRDLAIALHISSVEAEQIKIKLSNNGMPPLDTLDDSEPCIELSTNKKVSIQFIYDIVNSRFREILELAYSDIKQSGYIDTIGSGVFLIGGSSVYYQLPNIVEDVFQMPAKNVLPVTSTILNPSSINNQFYMQTLGLLAYYQMDKNNSSIKNAEENKGIFAQLNSWFN